jgi:aspartate racemase
MVYPMDLDQERINTIIFPELVNGVFAEESGAYFNTTIHKMKDRGCESVVMGCTEILLFE